MDIKFQQNLDESPQMFHLKITWGSLMYIQLYVPLIRNRGVATGAAAGCWCCYWLLLLAAAAAGCCCAAAASSSQQ
jgi:hypothetical protein